MSREDRTAWGRAGETSPLGKLDDDLPTIRLANETKALLLVQATKAGLNVSEYVRTWLEIHVHGEEHLKSLYADKLRRVSGKEASTPRNQEAQ